jgi:hypothetical protein
VNSLVKKSCQFIILLLLGVKISVSQSFQLDDTKIHQIISKAQLALDYYSRLGALGLVFKG